MTTIKADQVLSPSDVADLANVSRPVVSNWRKRYRDFPPAVGGTEAKPLFSREAVIAWLTGRGYSIQNENPGGLIWSALNTIRDRVRMEDAVNYVILLATLKKTSLSAFEEIRNSTIEGRARSFSRAIKRLQQLPGLRDLEPPPSLILSVDSVAVVEAISSTRSQDLADAVDFVLERLARSQVKGGAESGFIGSRTSKLLSSLASSIEGLTYDPACGIANVLIELAGSGAGGRLVGSDIDREALLIAAQRAVLHEADIQFFEGDVLAHDVATDIRAQVVVVEPPFSMHWDQIHAVADPRFTYGVPPKTSADLAWVQHALAHLASAGSAYVITSPGTLFRAGAERQIRANLLSAGCVEAVIGLPPRMLPQTAIAPALWVLRNPRDSPQVLFIDASEVQDVEFAAAEWLDRYRSELEIGIPHSVVSVTDILSDDANLTPAKWVGEVYSDDDVAESLAQSLQGAATLASQIGSFRLDLDLVANLPSARIATLGELANNGVIQMRRGTPESKINQISNISTRIVRAVDVKNRTLQPALAGQLPTNLDVTQRGDVLVTTMNQVRAVVDEDGGHIPSTGVDRLRILDTSLVLPEYLALILRGDWNTRLQSGTTIQRAPIRDLEIPLLPIASQFDLVRSHQGLSKLRDRAELLSMELEKVQSALLNSVRYDVRLPPMSLVTGSSD